MVQNYFKNIFRGDEEVFTSNNIKGLFPNLPATLWQKFNDPITNEDIKMAMFDMAPFKAPGPDGIPAGLFQAYGRRLARSFLRQRRIFSKEGICKKVLMTLS